MKSARVVANMTEQTATDMACVNFQTQLISAHFNALDGPAHEAPLELMSKRRHAQRVKGRPLPAEIEVHGLVRH
jgi:hypothetical protein